MSDARIEVSFDLPLKSPLMVDKGAELRLYDPTYYYSYTAVSVEPAENCELALRRFEPNQATSGLQVQLARLSREETPEQENVGRLFSDVIELKCA